MWGVSDLYTLILQEKGTPEGRIYTQKPMELTEASRPYRAWDRCGWKPPLWRKKTAHAHHEKQETATPSQRPEVQRFEPEGSETEGGFDCRHVTLLDTAENHSLVFVNRCYCVSLCPEVLVSPSWDKLQSLRVTPQAQS